jgi:predicted MFS family arabinose efflux permease
MLALLSVGLAIARVGRRALPPLLPTIIVDLAITPFQAGIALSLGSATFALLQFPSGRLSDQLSRKTVLLSSFAILIIGYMILSISITYVILLVGAAVIGIGEGLYGAADRGLLSDLFVEKRGVAFGIHTTFSDIGGIVAAGLAAAALAIGMWRMAFLPAVVALILLSFLLYWTGQEPVYVERPALKIRETVGRLFGRRRFQLLLVAYSLFALTSQGFIGFLPTLLQADKGFSPGLASLAFAGMFAVGIVARPIAGRLSDSRHRLVVAGGGLLIGAVGIFVLISAGSPLLAAIGIGTFAAGQKAFPPSMQAFLMDAFPDSSMAGDLGATRTVYIAIGSLGPAYVGYVGSRLSYTVAFTGFVGAFLVGGLIILSLMITE